MPSKSSAFSVGFTPRLHCPQRKEICGDGVEGWKKIRFFKRNHKLEDENEEESKKIRGRQMVGE